ncbi:MAG: hypothetical protein ACK5YO_32740, partial [Planctomyces sp.]
LTESILLDFGNQNAADDLNVAPGTTEFGGAVTLSITGFTALTGKFGFQKETAGTTTKIKLAATEITSFLGSNPDGVAGTAMDSVTAPPVVLMRAAREPSSVKPGM